MEQLELFTISTDSKLPIEDYSGLRDWELESEQNLFCNRTKDKHNESLDDNKKPFCNKNNISELAVTEYQPRGKAGGNNKYYRFSYREGKRVKHIHIKGGNTCNPIAIKHKDLVKAWIREDIPLEKIIKWIKEW